MKNILKKDVIVFGLSLAALICAAISLNNSLNELENKEQE